MFIISCPAVRTGISLKVWLPQVEPNLKYISNMITNLHYSYLLTGGT